MPLYIGAMGKGGYKLETGYGTGGTPPTIFLPIINEDMKANPEKIASPAMFGSRNTRTYYHGRHDPKGSVTFMADPDNIPSILFAALGVEGDAEQVGVTTAYDHAFTPAGNTVDLTSLALEVDREGTCCWYTGCVVNELSINAALGSPMQATMNILAKQEADDQSATVLTPSTLLPYIFHHGKVEVNDVQVYYVTGMNLTYNNGVDEASGFTLNGTTMRNHAYKTTGLLTGSMECEWTSVSDPLRDYYLDNTDTKIEFIFISTDAIEAGYYYTLTIEIPTAKIMGDPPVLSDRGRTPFTVNFEAVYNVTNYVKFTHRDARTTKWSA